MTIESTEKSMERSPWKRTWQVLLEGKSTSILNKGKGQLVLISLKNRTLSRLKRMPFQGLRPFLGKEGGRPDRFWQCRPAEKGIKRTLHTLPFIIGSRCDFRVPNGIREWVGPEEVTELVYAGKYFFLRGVELEVSDFYWGIIDVESEFFISKKSINY